MNRQSIISVSLMMVALGFFVFMLARNGSDDTPKIPKNSGGQAQNVQNVSMVDGKQVIDITARGGYSPRRSTAKAGIPTILRMNTNGSFDCSVALRIPKLGIAKNLEPSGTAEIDLGSPQAGTIRGLCSMGMYSFEIDFKA